MGSLDCCQGEDEGHQLALVLDVVLVLIASCGQSGRLQHPERHGISPNLPLPTEPLLPHAQVVVESHDVHPLDLP
eukprot:3331739-Amphidinium_carterae.1